jgi:glucan biosynthesis protein C
MNTRRNDIDWLRLLAVLLLFFFHTSRVFSPDEEFYAHNAITSPLLDQLFIQPVYPWHMPLFFLLAGASTWIVLQKKSGGQYLVGRFKRLFIPFIFGVFVVVSPQSYLGLLSHSDYTGSYLDWYPQFFQLQQDDLDGYFLGGHTWGHLWFIFHLFIYSLVAMPLFVFLRSKKGRSLLNNLANTCSSTLGVMLFPALLVWMHRFPEIAGGNPAFYITYFIFGYVIMSDHRYWNVIDKYRFVSLLLGPAFILAFVILNASSSMPSWIHDHWLHLLIEQYFYSFASWFTVIACLAWAKRLLNFSNRFLNYFTEGSYAIYILHQTIIIAVGYYIIQTEMPVGLKFISILLSSIVLTILTYDLIIRRSNTLRFLFGMKPKQ